MHVAAAHASAVKQEDAASEGLQGLLRDKLRLHDQAVELAVVQRLDRGARRRHLRVLDQTLAHIGGRAAGEHAFSGHHEGLDLPVLRGAAWVMGGREEGRGRAGRQMWRSWAQARQGVVGAALRRLTLSHSILMSSTHSANSSSSPSALALKRLVRQTARLSWAALGVAVLACSSTP